MLLPDLGRVIACQTCSTRERGGWRPTNACASSQPPSAIGCSHLGKSMRLMESYCWQVAALGIKWGASRQSAVGLIMLVQSLQGAATAVAELCTFAEAG